jgi:hypothetical protein
VPRWFAYPLNATVAPIGDHTLLTPRPIRCR